MRRDLQAIVRAALDGASVRHAVTRALARPAFAPFFSQPFHVVAAGKAAGGMAAALLEAADLPVRSALAIGTHAPPAIPPRLEWRLASHPLPDARSVAAAERALEIAASVGPDEGLLVLLSGGASAAMALPAEGLTLEDKQHTVRTMMLSGADIHALNTVRKHLSRVKGGRLAAACAGTTLTLAVSDVVGDDLSVIGSGPAVPDRTTWDDVGSLLEQFGGARHLASVRAIVEGGCAGALPDTPKPDDPALARATAVVIASQRDALAAAHEAAEALGYRVVIDTQVVSGEAREAARAWFTRSAAHTARRDAAVCVLSAGETTVRVGGTGRGGRNQEFALALVHALADAGDDLVLASVGTDGVDGPTDAAGAMVDATTRARAASLHLSPEAFLAENDSYHFFAPLGDLIQTGPTGTNVGDIQVLLAAAPAD